MQDYSLSTDKEKLQLSSPNQGSSVNLLKKFNNRRRSQINVLNPQRSGNFHKRITQNRRYKRFQNNQFQNEGTIENQDLFKMSNKIRYSNSYIIPNIRQLQQFFEYEIDFKLIYRASDLNFSVDKFHQLCDKYTDTLVICKTVNHQIIGGFTPLSWKQQYEQYGTYFKSDNSNQTFLFSLTKRQKFNLKNVNKNKAICCFQGYGPTFGGGYDLMIGDKTDQYYNSVSYFPRSYVSKNKLVTNHKYLIGSKNNQFKIIQWQVFHLNIHKPTFDQTKQIESNLSNQKEDKDLDKKWWGLMKKTVKNIFLNIN